MAPVPSLLSAFKSKTEQAVGLVPKMPAADKVKAIEFWNVVSEKLQEIVNNSADEINALEFEIDEETEAKVLPSDTSFDPHEGNLANDEIHNENPLDDQIFPSNIVQQSLIIIEESDTQPLTEANNLQELDEVPISTRKAPAKRRRRRRPGSVVKRAKRQDNDWLPLVEQQRLANRQGYVGLGAIRRSTRRPRRSFRLPVESNEADEDSDSVDNEKEDKEKLKDLDGVKMEDEGNGDEDRENKQTEKGKKRRCGEGRDLDAADGGEYTCELCNRKFSNIASLTTHRWIHTKPYGCADCTARFPKRANLIVHRRCHTGEKPYACNQCDAKFSTKGNVKRHLQTHSGEKPWKCSQCDGRFATSRSLKVHMRRHTGEKPYQCKVCEKRFSQSGILQTHMAVHMDQKTHLCDHCGKSFRIKSQLRLHMMRHNGVRKYLCAACPGRFLTKADLNRHNRIHTGERPFICELCGKTYTRPQALKEHMNRHYGLKPYECKYCGKNFAEVSACYKHIKKKHEQSQVAPVMQQHRVTMASADGQKFTVLVHTDEPFDDGEEVQQEQNIVIPADQSILIPADRSIVIPADSNITVTVSEQESDFAAINLLASASAIERTIELNPTTH